MKKIYVRRLTFGSYVKLFFLIGMAFGVVSALTTGLFELVTPYSYHTDTFVFQQFLVNLSSIHISGFCR